jgi:quercetin dioxygenase-like cupin family protein
MTNLSATFVKAGFSIFIITLAMKLTITPWTNPAQPTEPALRKLFFNENLSPYAWSTAPGDLYGEHFHTYDKVLYVARGSITWVFPSLQKEIETRAGDRIDLPRGLVHAARVGVHGVTCLEAHIG